MAPTGPFKPQGQLPDAGHYESLHEPHQPHHPHHHEPQVKPQHQQPKGQSKPGGLHDADNSATPELHLTCQGLPPNAYHVAQFLSDYHAQSSQEEFKVFTLHPADFNADTDRVVLELCSIEGLPDGIDEKIHKGKITGSFLVNNTTNEDTRRILYDTLGIGDVEDSFTRRLRSKIELPIYSASAFSQPTGSSEEPSRAEPQVGNNGDDEDGADHRGAHNSQTVSPPTATTEVDSYRRIFGPTRRHRLDRSSLDDENFEDSAGDPAEEREVEEEDTQDAADKDLPNYTDFTVARNGWCEKL
ncbi:uncharacterized protein PG986_014450 [Apiospora aurea]|uniref:Uncharacterized protein n=1 Tax=Apiospora aurea TaxID=335848 RepID=A0ABR1PT06_9PEZI